ncbi:hypothetical protein DFH28DRAFT_394828 [Melampsora americana]|nr:hypothetical protein DFH28DRAFT_394828 [Melampsora americana]
MVAIEPTQTSTKVMKNVPSTISNSKLKARTKTSNHKVIKHPSKTLKKALDEAVANSNSVTKRLTYEDKANEFLVKLKNRFNSDVVLERITCLTRYMNEFMLPKSGITTLKRISSYQMCFSILISFLKETQDLKSLQHIEATLIKIYKTSKSIYIKDLDEKWSLENLLKLYTYKVLKLKIGNPDYENTKIILQFQDYMNKQKAWSLDSKIKLLQFWTPRMSLFGTMQQEIDWWTEIDQIVSSKEGLVIQSLDCLEAKVNSLNQTNPNLEAILESYLNFLHEFSNHTTIEDHSLHAFFTQVKHPRLGVISCEVFKCRNRL